MKHLASISLVLLFAEGNVQITPNLGHAKSLFYSILLFTDFAPFHLCKLWSQGRQELFSNAIEVDWLLCSVVI